MSESHRDGTRGLTSLLLLAVLLPQLTGGAFVGGQQLQMLITLLLIASLFPRFGGIF